MALAGVLPFAAIVRRLARRVTATGIHAEALHGPVRLFRRSRRPRASEDERDGRGGQRAAGYDAHFHLDLPNESQPCSGPRQARTRLAELNSLRRRSALRRRRDETKISAVRRSETCRARRMAANDVATRAARDAFGQFARSREWERMVCRRRANRSLSNCLARRLMRKSQRRRLRDSSRAPSIAIFEERLDRLVLARSNPPRAALSSAVANSSKSAMAARSPRSRISIVPRAGRASLDSALRGEVEKERKLSYRGAGRARARPSP